MDTEMTRYESFAEVTEDFYCSAVDVLKILILRLHDYHARCFHSLRDVLYDYFLPMPHRILMPMFPLSIPSPRLALLVLPERILLTVQSMYRRFAMNFIYSFIILKLVPFSASLWQLC